MSLESQVKAISGGEPFDTQFLGGFYFTPFACLRFDELDDTDAQPTSPGAQDNAKGGRGFPFPAPGVDNHQTLSCFLA
jgi:hypothetical protein